MPDPLHDYGVSRETREKLRAFEALVYKWNSKINLVSRTDIEHIWDRHIVDSLQLTSHAADPSTWIDLGSGGGFPAIVVAIVIQSKQPQHIVMIDSDMRKCTFLRTAIRELGLTGQVITSRLDNADTPPAATLSARALMPLDKLLDHCPRFLRPNGTALFPKGRSWSEEIKAAQRRWSFDLDVIDSETSSEAAILRLSNIRRISTT